MSYCSMLFATDLESLADRRENLSRNFLLVQLNRRLAYITFSHPQGQIPSPQGSGRTINIQGQARSQRGFKGGRAPAKPECPPLEQKILHLSLIFQRPCPLIDRVVFLQKIGLLWAVPWASNMPKMHWRPGAPSRTPLGSSRRSPSPRPPSRLGRGTPVPNPHPLGAFGASILAPSALRSSCPPWKPGAPPADLELATVLSKALQSYDCSFIKYSLSHCQTKITN